MVGRSEGTYTRTESPSPGVPAGQTSAPQLGELILKLGSSSWDQPYPDSEAVPETAPETVGGPGRVECLGGLG